MNAWHVAQTPMAPVPPVSPSTTSMGSWETPVTTFQSEDQFYTDPKHMWMVAALALCSQVALREGPTWVGGEKTLVLLLHGSKVAHMVNDLKRMKV